MFVGYKVHKFLMKEFVMNLRVQMSYPFRIGLILKCTVVYFLVLEKMDDTPFN